MTDFSATCETCIRTLTRVDTQKVHTDFYETFSWIYLHDGICMRKSTKYLASQTQA